ncbi:alpha/beta fold hydrolase [Streptomyces sp. NBC_00234]|uniref:alpha/beta fold hydrolase n=1 Tax=Streptomyces sp. NBC_00234 TaxID=2903638 RepID=UPI002E29E12B|nr:alpha/beta fold hydrolase [Streptomyces sp. NBC_00234]
MANQPPSAAVLLLHGGREAGTGPPPFGPLNLPAVRMRPFRRAVAKATGPAGVLVRSVRYTVRGWNGPREDPLQDAVRALDALRREAGDIPVVLVGHSMGGRASLRAAGHPLVRAVVGLAPWCPPEDPVAQLADRDVVLIHGTHDRVTSPRASEVLADRARRAGARTCLVTVEGGDHAMLRSADRWHELTAALVTGLLGRSAMPDAVSAALRLPRDADSAHGMLGIDALPRPYGVARNGARP